MARLDDLLSRREGGFRRFKFKNPWVQQDCEMSRLVWGQEEVFWNQRAAEEAPVELCGLCGGVAYFHPAVGAYRCPRCRAMLLNGRWEK